MFSIVYFPLVFILPLLIINCVSMVSEIGNYSQYIKDYNLCGLSRNTLREESSDCFEYHKDFASNLRDARTAQTQESPWMVFIEGNTDTYLWFVKTRTTRNTCGGVLISDKWVLTAAHCLDQEEYKIYITHTSKVEEYIGSESYYQNPNYKDDKDSYDIGLIKLKEPFKSVNKNASTICLPSKHFDLKRRLALISGWAGHPELQVGPVTVYQMTDYQSGFIHVYYEGISYPRLRSCPGDSGSPIWIYHMGRAVLIGIHQARFDTDAQECGDAGDALYVPHHIDWILETIKKG